ncbi:hypothetical protein K2173_017315 [Erythroxylum novogranatense]|uniref:Uncharacterized protein n=1 Tax=Erythroxylum novogranatense TaxID=1862640 RepID=A0AAV8TK64_9ROSI|nr:hypothetical protein K2173_017315 [Erythroxylum novogranatense]
MFLNFRIQGVSSNLFMVAYFNIFNKMNGKNVLRVPLEEATKNSLSNLQSNGGGSRVENKMCNSFVKLVEDLPFVVMLCDICYIEPNFYCDCCCILYCKIVKLNHGGYSYMKYEIIVSDGFICGHVAHIDCALRTYMDGIVGGIIGLDAEYYCKYEIEKLLNVGISILYVSKKIEIIKTLRHMDLTFKKLNFRTYLEDIWKADKDLLAISNGATTNQNFVDNSMSFLYILSNFTEFRYESLKLEDEIDHVLKALQIKKYLQNLYQQLDKQRIALACRIGVDQVKQEVVKLERMKEVYKGFRRTSKAILKEHFGLEI